MRKGDPTTSITSGCLLDNESERKTWEDRRHDLTIRLCIERKSKKGKKRKYTTDIQVVLVANKGRENRNVQEFLQVAKKVMT